MLNAEQGERATPGGLEVPAEPPPKDPDFASPLITFEQDELINSFKQVLRAELNSFGAKFLVHPALKRQQPQQQPQQQHRFKVARQPTNASAPESSFSPHAWVNRGIRSYAVGAELSDPEGLTDMVSLGSNRSTKSVPDRLLPDVIPKGSGPLAQHRRRLGTSSSEGQGPLLAAKQAKFLSVLAMDSRCSEPPNNRSSNKKSKNLLSPHQQNDGTKQAWSDRRSDKIPSYALSLNSDESGLVSELSGTPSAYAHALTELSAQQVVPSQRSCQPALSKASSSRESPPGDLDHLSSADRLAAMQRSRDDGSVAQASKEVASLADAFQEEDSVGSNGDSEESLGPRSTKRSVFKKMTTIYSAVSSVFRRSEGTRRPAAKVSLCHMFVYTLVRNIYFENLTVAFILANAITIGIQTDHSARHLSNEGPPGLRVMNLVIAAFFCLELAMRLFAFRRHFFTMTSWKWNVLDLIVVGLQILEEVMSSLRLEESNMPIALSLVRMLRIMRLIRIIRVVRLLRYLSELRTLVVSITGSMKPLCSTIVLLALVVYIVGIYFTQLTLEYRIDNSGSSSADELEEYFGSVGTTVIALFQTVTGGLEWRNMLTPLMSHISPALSIVFALYIVFTSLALMNIVTGVFVETALQRGREDKDVYMINHLKDLFGSLDENRNGTISWHELEEHLDDPKLMAFFKDIDIDICEAKGLFHLLDRDASGSIDADEFLSGCLRLRGPAKALDLQLVMLELADQRRSFQRLLDEWAPFQ